ncbi:MAG TPA: serine hydrolase [Thermoanaerobaculia bacterium]|nr:serine hydrolase [Thermoanaerobaculia bacterium]
MRRVLVALLFVAAFARADFREFTDVPKDPSIETKLRAAAEQTLRDFPKLKADDLAISVIDVTRPATLARGDYHGDAPFYPASVIKLFYMTTVYAQHKESTGDMDRALKEMIHVSDNDATAFIVDVTTDTCSGANLEGRALRRFIERRRATNKWFARYGYDISAMAKAWSFGPFGRDVQVMGPNRINRNRLTANATASLLLWIERRRAVSASASEAMMTLLERPLDPLRKDENQVREFIGESLPPGTKLWSKAGWTSEVRHDAAYLELPDGRKLVLVIFTRGIADDVTLIPAIAKNVLGELSTQVR